MNKVAYHLIDKPAAVLSALLRLGDSLVDLEMPVHVGRLLLLALLVRCEASSALRALRAQRIEQEGEKVWAVSELQLTSVHISTTACVKAQSITYCLSDGPFSWMSRVKLSSVGGPSEGRGNGKEMGGGGGRPPG
jgi:hypothetical protein